MLIQSWVACVLLRAGHHVLRKKYMTAKAPPLLVLFSGDLAERSGVRATRGVSPFETQKPNNCRRLVSLRTHAPTFESIPVPSEYHSVLTADEWWRGAFPGSRSPWGRLPKTIGTSALLCSGHGSVWPSRDHRKTVGVRSCQSRYTARALRVKKHVSGAS